MTLEREYKHHKLSYFKKRPLFALQRTQGPLILELLKHLTLNLSKSLLVGQVQCVDVRLSIYPGCEGDMDCTVSLSDLCI